MTMIASHPDLTAHVASFQQLNGHERARREQLGEYFHALTWRSRGRDFEHAFETRLAVKRLLTNRLKYPTFLQDELKKIKDGDYQEFLDLQENLGGQDSFIRVVTGVGRQDPKEVYRIQHRRELGLNRYFGEGSGFDQIMRNRQVSGQLHKLVEEAQYEAFARRKEQRDENYAKFHALGPSWNLADTLQQAEGALDAVRWISSLTKRYYVPRSTLSLTKRQQDRYDKSVEQLRAEWE